MALALLDKVSINQKAFGDKVIEIAGKLGINPDWLMFPMYFESKFNPAAVNPYSGATGLIQFMPSTAKSLGTSLDALRNMNNVKQLDYVYKYFLPYKSKIKSALDAYLAVFFPSAIGKSADTVIEAKKLPPDVVAKANPIFDLNKDGKITIAEIAETLSKKVPDSLKKFFTAPTTIGAGAFIIGGLILWFILKK